MHAYALMTNHVHLLATPGKAEAVPRLIISPGRRYVQYVNITYRRTGTLWDSRYKSSLIQPETYFLSRMRYIELNPVRAAMVDDPSHYRCCIPSVATRRTSFRCEKQKSMKLATTLKPPKNISRKSVDPDNPPWSEEMLGPPVVRRGRGAQKAPTKVSTTVRLDADILAWFKSQGPGYQTRINEALRLVVEQGLTTRSPRTRRRGARR